MQHVLLGSCALPLRGCSPPPWAAGATTDVSTMCPWRIHDMSMMCPQCVPNLSVTCLWHVCDLSATCPQPVRDLSVTCPQPVCDLSATCPQPLCDRSIVSTTLFVIWKLGLTSWLFLKIRFYWPFVSVNCLVQEERLTVSWVLVRSITHRNLKSKQFFVQITQPSIWNSTRFFG